MSSSSEQWPPPPRDKHLTCFTETLLLLGGTNGRCARKLLGHFVYCLNLSLLALDPSRFDPQPYPPPDGHSCSSVQR